VTQKERSILENIDKHMNRIESKVDRIENKLFIGNGEKAITQQVSNNSKSIETLENYVEEDKKKPDEYGKWFIRIGMFIIALAVAIFGIFQYRISMETLKMQEKMMQDKIKIGSANGK